MPDSDWSSGAYLAEFADAEQLRLAVRVLRHKGYTYLETYAPMPNTSALSHGRSWLPFIVFLGGLSGGVISYAIQWYTNARSYPLDLGGRPANAIPAFIVSTFEGAVLFAALTAFVVFFMIVGLPRLWHPVFEVDGFERATVDRYWLAVDGLDPWTHADATMRDLNELSPIRVVTVDPQS